MDDNATELVIDARDLEPPEPMELAVAALEELQPGQQLRFLIHRQPYPLYDLLRRYHYHYEVAPLAEGGFSILISKL